MSGRVLKLILAPATLDLERLRLQGRRFKISTSIQTDALLFPASYGICEVLKYHQLGGEAKGLANYASIWADQI